MREKKRKPWNLLPYTAKKVFNVTGKSLSKALIFASTNPQYDNRSFIELQVQYMKIPSSNLGRTWFVSDIHNNFCTQYVLPRFEFGIFMHWTCYSMKNMLSYCWLIDAKIRASKAASKQEGPKKFGVPDKKQSFY